MFEFWISGYLVLVLCLYFISLTQRRLSRKCHTILKCLTKPNPSKQTETEIKTLVKKKLIEQNGRNRALQPSGGLRGWFLYLLFSYGPYNLQIHRPPCAPVRCLNRGWLIEHELSHIRTAFWVITVGSSSSVPAVCGGIRLFRSISCLAEDARGEGGVCARG